MPTPFMHLQFAEQMRSQVTDREAGNGRLPEQLLAEWPAFYLGSVAADLNTICGIPREATHFYGLPPEPDNQAYPRMLAQYPVLADVAHMPTGQALFVAAYCIHLLFDLVWFRQILMPYFVESGEWANRQQRFLAHNILLTYLDKLALASLPVDAAATLDRVRPRGWLPFAGDQDLVAWQAMLVEQLQPGAPIRTVEIYAKRMRMSAAEFSARLKDGQWMRLQVFDKVPLAEVQARLHGAIFPGIQLLVDFMKLKGT